MASLKRLDGWSTTGEVRGHDQGDPGNQHSEDGVGEARGRHDEGEADELEDLAAVQPQVGGHREERVYHRFVTDSSGGVIVMAAS